MAETAISIELGFAEKSDSWKLKSKFFPSKLGGKPAWLDLKSLPDTRCSCGEPMSFIMQVYAPLDDHPTCFHRTLFVFGCPPCVDKRKDRSVIIFRSQLGLVNEFYPDTPAVEVEKDSDKPSAQDFRDLCCVCGCLSFSKCSLCKMRNYCSKQHQVIDWKKAHKFVCIGQQQKEPLTVKAKMSEAVETAEKNGEVPASSPNVENSSGCYDDSPLNMGALKIDWENMHKSDKKEKDETCSDKADRNGDDIKKKRKKEAPKKEYVFKGIFPEYEIETEPEELHDEKEHREDNQEDLANYLKKMDKQSQLQMKEMASCSDKDLKEIEDMSKALEDKAFKRFKKVIDPYPEQIIRYCRGADPLWVSAESIPEDIPKCENCGSSREFEFQIMPQALNLLKSDLLDWGTLVIYTCKQSCDVKGYAEEFIHRQDFV